MENTELSEILMRRIKKWIGQMIATGVVIAVMMAIFAGAVSISRTFLGEDGVLVGVLIGGLINAFALNGLRRFAEIMARKAKAAKRKAEAASST
jgi:hypothetical protein